jgi:hypothetical protein
VDEELRCWRCGDVIGVHELMVVFAEGESRETSLLNEQAEGPVGDCYHRRCFHEAHDEGRLDS